jgi:hypothetical protein
MSDQEMTGGPPAADGPARAHPEEPAEGADEGQHDTEEQEVRRRHAQEPAEGAEDPAGNG